MPTPTNADDLPDSSVVADTFTAYIKTHPTHWCQWRATNGGYFTNSQVDEVLANGGQVLRVDDGKDSSR